MSRLMSLKINHIASKHFWHFCASSNMRATNLKCFTLAMIVPLDSSLFLHTGLLAKQGSDKPFQADRNPHLKLQPIKESLVICFLPGWINSLSTQVKWPWIVPSTVQIQTQQALKKQLMPI